MTVATPTTGLSFAPTIEPAARILVTCTACKSAADAREPFCAHCGSRVALVEGPVGKKRPADVAATRALQFGLVVVLANLLVGGLGVGVVMLVSDAVHYTEVALALDVLKFVVVGSLSIVAIRYGVRGMRATADGALRRRGWAVMGIVIGSVFALLVTLSMLATFTMTVLIPGIA